MNASVQRAFIRGMKQQLWFWGVDTCERSNNLLEAYGFRRFKSRFVGGSSRYRMTWKGRAIELHSFCAGIYGGGKDGFVYIRKWDQGFAYTCERPPIPNRYRGDCLVSPKAESQRVCEAAASFLEWIENYENWVDKNYGHAYREQCFRDYHRKWLPPKQAREWFQLYRNAPELLVSWGSKLKLALAA